MDAAADEAYVSQVLIDYPHAAAQAPEVARFAAAQPAAALGALVEALNDPHAAYDALARADLWALLGLARATSGDQAGALEAFETALRFAPECCAAGKHLPFLLQTAGRLREAEAAYARCCARDPLDAAAVLNYGVMLSGRGAYQEAKEIYLGFSQAGGADAAIAVNAAKLAAERGWLRDVKSLVERSLPLAGDDNRLLAAHYVVCAGLGNYSEALASAQSTLHREPGFQLQSFRCHLPFSA